MTDDPTDDASQDLSSDVSTDIQTNAVNSNYKVLGQLSADNGVGVLGQNDAGSGTPIGVKGAVPNATTNGYGLSTPHNANVGGSLEASAILTDRLEILHRLPPLEAIGNEPQRSRDALRMLFSESPWTDFRYQSGPNHGETASGTAFMGIALATTGVVVFPPNKSDNVGLYDPRSNTYTSGATHGESGTFAFADGSLAPTGDVIFAPFDSDNIGVYDPVTDIYTSGPAHNEGPTAFEGAVLAPTGEIVFSPASSANVGIYDPSTNTYTSGPSHGEGDGDITFFGATLAPTGHIVFTPNTSPNIGVLDTHTQTAKPRATTLHPLVNT